jgi:predicted ArsR family transcriptional regulator
VLERNGGNRTKAAKDLEVDPRTIFRHLEKLEAERRDANGTSAGSPGGSQ